MKTIHNTSYETMIARLVTARKSQRLTQAMVASRLGKPQSYVSKIELCERRLDIYELKEFLDIYRMRSTEIYGE
ncbi:MAG: helix-turn-helix transcriptional regulator [Coriobacteriia bacterium]|nr:helix-turn-helix transcriptional regulator [Coriobacteriia bacterium]MCL2537608.1 helix-turn-helix transcriptional regulator [Coriobacteriia bacterium]